MRHFLTTVILLTCFATLQGQTYEIGVIAGGTNFIGDVGSTNYISPNAVMAGGMFRYNRNPRVTYRFTAKFGSLQADDLKSDDASRQVRGYEFSTDMLELGAGIEYSFWEFNLHESFNKPATPYLHTGIEFFNHDLFRPSANGLIKTDNEWDFAIPLTLGFKMAIGSRFIAGAEIGARYTFIDHMDGSVQEANPENPPYFGNISNDDWYMFTGVTLTYTFGRRPCYCGF